MLVGRPWTDARLLALAYAFEQAHPIRRPPEQINPAAFRRFPDGMSYRPDDCRPVTLSGWRCTDRGQLHRCKSWAYRAVNTTAHSIRSERSPMLNLAPIRIHRPRRTAWLVALTVIATGLVILPATPAAAAGLNVTISPPFAYVPGSSMFWPGQSATVTGSMTVVNNPAFSETIVIVDQTLGQTIRTCNGHQANGTFSCSVVVTESNTNGGTTHVYYAAAQELAQAGTFTGQSSSVQIMWNANASTLQGQANGQPNLNTIPVGTVVTLTVTSILDVGPSPYYLEIFDITAGTLLDWRGYGTSFSITVAQNSPTSHVYRGYVAPYTTTPPQIGPFWCSGDVLVTWNDGLHTPPPPR
jgi:hypothetical protein